MMRAICLLGVLLAVTPAYAGTVNYACHGDEALPLYSAKLDLGKHTLTWRGKTYRNIKRIYNNTECSKDCFENDRVRLTTATDGIATLAITFGTGPGDDGAEFFECDVVREDKR
jgi:hypothetical protein